MPERERPERPGPPVTVLASGVALGVYVPAVLVTRRLEELGVPAGVEVIEALYGAAHVERLAALRLAYHRSFAMALLGHRMTTDVQASLDDDRVGGLLDRWEAERRREFVVWSGFWMPLLDAYRRRVAPAEVAVDVCRIDAVVSATFKRHRLSDGDTEVWLWNASDGRLHHEIPVGGPPSPAYLDRPHRFVIHGGGWGMGTYQDRIPELQAAGLALDIVGYEPADVAGRHPACRYFMVDPAWVAWERGADGRHEFPPFGEVGPAGGGEFRRAAAYHPFYDLAAAGLAIISKPGGGTLIDSFAAATPVVLLEPYGYAEERNAEVWRRLGFGIAYDDWRATGFDLGVLAELHRNLAAAPRPPGYPEAYAARRAARSAGAGVRAGG